MNENQLRREMIETGKQLYEKSLIAAAEGNFSVRLDAQRILATPTGLCKGKMAADDLVIIDPDGNHISGERRASSEIKMHLEVYRRRPDAQAVIHAHPPICIALMLAGIGLDRPVLAENVVLMGKVPSAPYARPSTDAVPESIRPFIERTDFLLLDRHGSLTVGATLDEAFRKQEMLEHTAKSVHAALQLGDIRDLPADEIAAVNDLRVNRYRIPWQLIPF